jgi:hypothetical protein
VIRLRYRRDDRKLEDHAGPVNLESC